MISELKVKRLGTVTNRSWVQFRDGGGYGYAEPDGWIEYPDRIFLFECKLTGGVAGKMQMEGLYKPLLEKIFGKPCVCLLICKWINPGTPGPFFGSPEDFLRSGERFGTWQWLPD